MQNDKNEDVERLPFWMLKAPIYRSLSVTPSPVSPGQSRSPLFEEGRKPINCLIIEADVTGEVEVPGSSELVRLPELGNIDTECDWLEARLKDHRNQDEWEIGHVARINLAAVPADKSFSNYLEDTLAEREWHLVHYSGHSLYVPSKEGPAGRGFLFLPGSGRPRSFAKGAWIPSLHRETWFSATNVEPFSRPDSGARFGAR